MRTRECATCVKLWDCKGKDTKDPCLNYQKYEPKDKQKSFFERMMQEESEDNKNV